MGRARDKITKEVCGEFNKSSTCPVNTTEKNVRFFYVKTNLAYEIGMCIYM